MLGGHGRLTQARSRRCADARFAGIDLPEAAMIDTLHIIGPPGDEPGRLAAVAAREAEAVQTYASLEQFLRDATPGGRDCVAAFSDIAGALLDAVHARKWALPVIVLGRDDALGMAIGLMRKGAAEYLVSPVRDRHLQKAIRKVSSCQ
jgi:hypothetical protein